MEGLIQYCSHTTEVVTQPYEVTWGVTVNPVVNRGKLLQINGHRGTQREERATEKKFCGPLNFSVVLCEQNIFYDLFFTYSEGSIP